MDDTNGLQLQGMLSQLSDNLVSIHMNNVPHRHISDNQSDALRSEIVQSGWSRRLHGRFDHLPEARHYAVTSYAMLRIVVPSRPPGYRES